MSLSTKYVSSAEPQRQPKDSSTRDCEDTWQPGENLLKQLANSIPHDSIYLVSNYCDGGFAYELPADASSPKAPSRE